MKNKKALTLIITIILIFAGNLLAVGAQDNPAMISVSPELQQVNAGQEFNVSVNIAGAQQVYGASFKLMFDPQAFEVVSENNTAIIPGAFFEGEPGFTLKNTVDAENGIIDYALTLMQPAEPVSGDGILGTVTFRALKDSETTISAVEASLVSPEFKDVGGRLIAEHINQVPAQIGQPAPVVESAPVVAENSNTASVSAAPASAAVKADATAMFNNPALNTKPAVTSTPNSSLSSNLPLIIAGVFFVVGLVLLTVSVGMYSRMRVRFNLLAMSQSQIEVY